MVGVQANKGVIPLRYAGNNKGRRIQMSVAEYNICKYSCVGKVIYLEGYSSWLKRTVLKNLSA